jgi:hypothetical protein
MTYNSTIEIRDERRGLAIFKSDPRE